MTKYLATVAAAFFLFSATAHAQIAGGDAPVVIQGDRFDGYQADGRGVWVGNVRATQGESLLTTDKLITVCPPAAPAQNGADGSCEEIRQLIAENNVLYTAPNLKIRGDRAEYDYPTDTITITGDVILTRGDEAVMRGNKVVYQVSAGQANVTANTGRVTGIFTPQRGANSNQPAQPQPPARPN